MSAARAIVVGLSASRTRDEHRAGRVLDGLGDQRQPVLVVAVEDDERQVRVLARDQLDRLRDRHRERRHLVAEAVEHVAERAQILLALVGEQDPQIRLARSPGRVGHLRNRSSTLVRAPAVTPPDGLTRPSTPARHLPIERVRAYGASRRSIRWALTRREHIPQTRTSRAARSRADRAAARARARRRPAGPRGARPALPAARPPARAPLPARRRAARRPRSRSPRSGC